MRLWPRKPRQQSSVHPYTPPVVNRGYSPYSTEELLTPWKPLRGGLFCPRCNKKMEDRDAVEFAPGKGVYALCANCRSVLTHDEQLAYFRNLWLVWVDGNNDHPYRQLLRTGKMDWDKVLHSVRESYDSLALIEKTITNACAEFKDGGK